MGLVYGLSHDIDNHVYVRHVHNVSTTYFWSSSSDGVDYNLYGPDYSIVLLHVPLTVGRFSSLSSTCVLATIAQKLLLPTSHPRKDARMARRQQNRAAQDSAVGRKILDRASKSVTSCNVDSPETK